MKTEAFIVISETPEWREMAHECAARLVSFGGIHRVEIVSTQSASEARWKKLAAFLEYSGPVWLVDADLWMVAKHDLPNVGGPVLLASGNDAGFELSDGTRIDARMIQAGNCYDGLGLPINETVNTALVSLDMEESRCRQLIRTALDLQTLHFGTGEVTHTEAFLNAAARRLDLTVARLTNRWNWVGGEGGPPAGTLAVHAACKRGAAAKLGWLRGVTS